MHARTLVIAWATLMPLLSRAMSRDNAPLKLPYLLAHTSGWGVSKNSRILTPCYLVFVGRRRSQHPGPSSTLGSFKLSYNSRESLWGPSCAHGISGTLHGEVRNTYYGQGYLRGDRHSNHYYRRKILYPYWSQYYPKEEVYPYPSRPSGLINHGRLENPRKVMDNMSQKTAPRSGTLAYHNGKGTPMSIIIIFNRVIESQTVHYLWNIKNKQIIMRRSPGW